MLIHIWQNALYILLRAPPLGIKFFHVSSCNALYFHYQGKNNGLWIITRQNDIFSSNDPNQSDAMQQNDS